jgi:cobalt/nickel transport system permease protein
LAGALGLILMVAWAPRFWWVVYAAVAGGLGLLMVVARVRWGAFLRRLLWLEPVAAGVAVLALLQPDGGRVFAAMMIKSTLCLTTMIVLNGTTPFSQILAVLRRCHLPGLLVTSLALTHRYLFVLLEETGRLRRARLSRTFQHNKTQVWRSLATVLGQLFLRTSERAERIYAAMCARGWKP